MLKLRKDFNIKKLKFWGFEEHDGKWSRDIEDYGWLYIEIQDNREVKICFIAGEDVKEDTTFKMDFDKTIFDLIKAEVFVWN